MMRMDTSVANLSREPWTKVSNARSSGRQEHRMERETFEVGSEWNDEDYGEVGMG